MKLAELLSVLPSAKEQYRASAEQIEVVSLTNDARQVRLGAVFVAIRGTKNDGHKFINNAVQQGAIALVVESKEKIPDSFNGSTIVVKDSRIALDLLASHFYSNPSKEMFCFGVTGTNGKTSVTYMLECVLGKAGIATGVLGTIDHHLGTQVWPSEMTTPDPIMLQQRLREMRNSGARAVAMEVSSHALSQARADGVHFNTAIFTNLTRDHLDYHKDMQEYFETKQKLFTEAMRRTVKIPHFAIVNVDDPWGRKMRVEGQTGIWSYGQAKDADLRFHIVEMDFSKTYFELHSPFGFHKSWIPMCGVHNVYNAVAVVAAAATAGIPPKYSLEALSTFAGVPGRLQNVPNHKSLHVYVDYAHSPDALENVLKSLGRVRSDLKAHNKIWTVFGCGGDRDKGKRPLMAQIAARYSDRMMVTSDNPRTEDPLQIINDILEGFSATERKGAMVEVDRKKAIQKVISQAQPGDVILIAGKGHEDYQILGTEKIHFSDFEVAKEFLA